MCGSGRICQLASTGAGGHAERPAAPPTSRTAPGPPSTPRSPRRARRGAPSDRRAWPARVVGQVLPADQRGHGAPLVGRAHGERHPVVGADAPVHALRRHPRVAVGHRRAHLAGALQGDQRVDAGDHAALVERHLDPLALAGARPVVQRRHDRHGGVVARHRVGVEQRGARQLPVGVAGDRRQRAGGLDVGPVGHPVALGPVGPVARHRHHDQRRVHRPQLLVAEPEVGHHAGAVVLQHDVGRAHQLEERRLAVGRGQVDAHPALVAVHLVEVHRPVPRLALLVLRRADPHQGACRRPSGPLDLDAVAAEVGEEPSGHRAGPVGGDLDDPQPFQRRPFGGDRGARRRRPALSSRRPVVGPERRRRTAACRRGGREPVRLARVAHVAVALPPVARLAAARRRARRGRRAPG